MYRGKENGRMGDVIKNAHQNPITCAYTPPCTPSALFGNHQMMIVAVLRIASS